MTLYEILGVPPGATPDQIKKAYRKLCMKHHPDRGGDKATFQALEQAYATLSDPEKRKHYDETGEAGGAPRELTPRDKAMRLLPELISEVMTCIKDPETINLVEKMSERLGKVYLQHSQSKDGWSAERKRLGKVLKRLRVAKGKENVLAMATQSLIDTLSGQITKVDQHLAMLQAALDLVNEHDYEFEPPKEPEAWISFPPGTFRQSVYP